MRLQPVVSILCVISASPFLYGQSSEPSDIDLLKAQVAAQAKQLEAQQKRIDALESTLRVIGSKSVADQPVSLVPAMNRGEVLPSLPRTGGGPEPPIPSTPAQQVVPSDSTQVENPPVPFDPDQELDVQPQETGPALKLGPAKIQMLGYVALTGFVRSTNGGGNVGTSFGSIPYSSTAPGNLTEFRLSPQSTRLALRADADLGSSKVAGYFEFDFGGIVPGNVTVTSSSYGFRIRQGWMDYQGGKWEITAGQTFSLLTPMKRDILPWPGDVSTTQVIDTNYVAGLVWARDPQVRIVYHASKNASYGMSFENPEQQVGGTVVFPAGLASTLNGQYDIGTNELKVPNALPDFVFKASFDGKPGGRSVHLDAGALLRVFRSSSAIDPITNHETAIGYGGNLNGIFEVAKGLRVLFNGYASHGGGRYIGGLYPDVIVTATGSIQPINAYSWLGGIEYAATKTSSFYGYYSGAYGQRQTAIDLNGNYIGWGFPGASNSANRTLNEISVGWGQVFWKHEGLGSVQLGAQYSYLERYPWSQGSGPTNAWTNMVFSQVRYNLP